MAGLPGMPGIPGGGLRQQRAAALKAEAERKARLQEEAARREQEQAATTSAGEETLVDGQRAADEEDAEDQGTGPVGQGEHVVQQGECIESIAYDHGFFWETLWNDPQNAELQRVRKNPNALLPDDTVHIREKCPKSEPGATEQHHRFRRKGIPSNIYLVIKRHGKPRAKVPYVLKIDAIVFSDRTNTLGEIKHPIPPNARKGKLTVGEGDDAEEYELKLRHMDPITEISGIQGRLNNIGFDCGEPDGRMSPRTIAALRAFQKRFNLDVTGEIDQDTKRALKEHSAS